MADHGTVEVPLWAKDGTIRAYALVDEADADAVLAHRWCLNAGGYAKRAVQHCNRHETILLHRQLMGLGRGDPRRVDHRNLNRLDCRRSNLRLATHAENMQNQADFGNRGPKTSRYRGVTRRKDNGQWQAQAGLGKVHYHLGTYATEDEAARVVAAFRAERMPFSAEAAAA